MQINFFSSGSIEQISGGFIYNRHIIEYLRAHNVGVSYCSNPESLSEAGEGTMAIIDSLIIPDSIDQLLQLPSQTLLLMHMRFADDFANTSDFAALVRKSHLVVTGEHTRSWLRNAVADSSTDIALIEPGVPERWVRVDRSPSSTHRLLCLANYVRGKGHDRLLNVMSQLRDLQWTLHMYGNQFLDAECFEAVRQNVRKLGLQDRIQVSGAIPHASVLEQMREADMLLQPSANESYSMVTAEAIACGLPVLSPRTGNWKAFEQTGIVHYLHGNGSGEWVAVLTAMILGEERFKQLNCSNSIPTRTWEHVGQDFLELLKTIR